MKNITAKSNTVSFIFEFNIGITKRQSKKKQVTQS